MVHCNIRSAQLNLSNFENYLSVLHHRFNFIAISENCLSANNCDLFYTLHFCHEPSFQVASVREGVSLFISACGKQLLQLCDNCFPQVQMTHYHNRLTPGLKKSIHTKNKFYAKSVKSPIDAYIFYYKQCEHAL